MTHAYRGLSRAFPYVKLPLNLPLIALTSLSTASAAFVNSSHGDAGADADAAVGLLKVSSQTSR